MLNRNLGWRISYELFSKSWALVGYKLYVLSIEGYQNKTLSLEIPHSKHRGFQELGDPFWLLFYDKDDSILLGSSRHPYVCKHPQYPGK